MRYVIALAGHLDGQQKISMSGARIELAIFGLPSLGEGHTKYETDALPTEPTRRVGLGAMARNHLRNYTVLRVHTFGASIIVSSYF